jgi:3-oxoacyl-[acyl-carrier protein] reductase
VSDTARCAAAVADTVAGFGALDALVHWAAIHSTETWDELTAEAFDKVLRVNVTGAFLMSQAAARHMVPNRRGAIVLTASTSVLSSGVGGNGRGGPAYTSSKGAIIVLTRALARSLGPHGIRVNAVSPGSTDTPMIAEYSGAAREGAAARAALGRIGDAAEIAAVARFLISDDASFIAGAVINANGGAAFS